MAYFTPTVHGKHSINVKNSGRPARGSPFEVDIAEETDPNGRNAKHATLY